MGRCRLDPFKSDAFHIPLPCLFLFDEIYHFIALYAGLFTYHRDSMTSSAVILGFKPRGSKNKIKPWQWIWLERRRR